MDPILDNIDDTLQAGLEYLEEQKLLKEQEQVVDPEAPQPEAPQPEPKKKGSYKESQTYINALNGIEPTQAELEQFTFRERADIGSTWIRNSRKSKDPSQYGITENTQELFSAVQGGAAKTWSSILTFPERVIDMATGTYEREAAQPGGYKPDFDPLSLSEYDPELKTWWGKLMQTGVHFYGLGRAVSRAPGAGMLPKGAVAKDVAVGAISSAISSTSQEGNLSQELYEKELVKKVPWVGEVLSPVVQPVLGTLATKETDHPLMKTFKNVLEGMGADAIIGRVLKRFDTAVDNRGTQLDEMRRANIENQKFEAAKAENDAIEANLPQQMADLQQASEALDGLEAQAKAMYLPLLLSSAFFGTHPFAS